MNKKRNPWRIARIAIAGGVFCSLFAAVWFSRNICGAFLTQAAPDFGSLIFNLTIGAGCALAGLLLLTLLAGRVYCSFLCPLGILQDLMSLFRGKPYRYLPWKRKVRTPFFLLILGLAVTGLMLPLALLLPSSNFVMIVNNVFREIVQWCCGAFLKEPVTIRPMAAVQIVSWLIFLFLFALVRWNGRTFCNTLCPVGAVLGYCAKISRFKIVLDETKCVSCGSCEKFCKGSCIDSRNKKIYSDECVMCLNCLSACPKDALKLHRAPVSQEVFHTGRRDFLKDSGALAGGLLLGSSAKLIASEKKPVMPPGAGTYERFSARCLRCGLCISACRGKVLKAATHEYGVKGLMLPVLDPCRGACDFNCSNCSEVCPCGALSPLTLTAKRSLRIGLAHVVADRCVAFAKDQDCGACAEHCPVGALEMVVRESGGAGVPKVNAKLCIGCGACQNICPVRPQAAITVEGVSPQCTVEKPQKKEAIKLSAEEDFPF